MGLFSWASRPKVVSVNFRALTRDAEIDLSRTYAYRWELKERPAVGMRVWVSGSSGRSAAVVAALRNTSNHPATKRVLGVVTQQEIDAAVGKERQVEADWLEMMRKAAGFPSNSRKRKVPDGYPEIPPAEGGATKHVAAAYAQAWWRAYKRAEAAGLPADEVRTFSSLAHRWFAIRDRG